MRFGYFDPPYLGCCAYYGHEHGSLGRPFDGRCWNEIETHRALLTWAHAEFPDGGAMSMSSPTIPILLLHAGDRVGAWVKPFASFKPGVNPGYCWEPVVFWGGRKLGRDVDTVRDYVSAAIKLEAGTVGAKPPGFCAWILDLMGYQYGDEFVDLFSGSGAFGQARHARDMNPRLL